MSSYAFWNNKGGVGKSFLCFVAGSEYAHRYSNTDVYVIDLCPQANVSETLLGGFPGGPTALRGLVSRTPRATVAGYLEARLNSPFVMLRDVDAYVCHPSEYNADIPANLKLVSGDNLLEIIAEAIRQTSQLAIPVDAWKQVLNWIRDLTGALEARSGNRDTLFLMDCNPSFAVYTQLALVSADYLVVPFTADDSSRRAIENVVALLYGITDSPAEAYARLSFAKRAQEEGLSIPTLHTFVTNRVTQYRGRASTAFKAVRQTIEQTMQKMYSAHRHIFFNPKEGPAEKFIEVPDYHSACVVATTTGTPLHKLKAGPATVAGERLQLNAGPLDRYKVALGKFVDCL
jgi:cellulose biosynthesis protein BcsQ